MDKYDILAVTGLCGLLLIIMGSFLFDWRVGLIILGAIIIWISSESGKI